MTRRAIPAEDFDHGDARRYHRGCRCQPCTTAATNAARINRYLRQTGRGTLTAPDQAAAHIHRLRATGMSDTQIRTAADVVPDQLYRILRNQNPIRRSTEQRILAVRPYQEEAAGSGAHGPNLGTVRRLRTLAADGWPAAEIGRRAGKCKQFIVQLQNSRTDGRVRLWVADYTRTLYTELRPLTPENEGVNRSFALRARLLAAKKGWAGSDYWDADDFDNPNFQPATGATRFGRDELAAHRRAEVEHLATFNLSDHDIADRLDMALSTVQGIVRELRRGERRNRKQVAA